MRKRGNDGWSGGYAVKRFTILVSALFLCAGFLAPHAYDPAGDVCRAGAAPFIIIPAAALLGYHAATGYLVDRYIDTVPRDPETGIMIGAEARDLGPPDAKTAVLCVHGFIGATNNFNELPERIAATGRFVRVMRLPGHGTSPREFERVTPDELIAAVRGETERLRGRHERIVLVGHSMGGTLSALTASEGDVDGLVLAAPYFGVRHHWYYGLRPETWTGLLSPALRWIHKSDGFVKVERREVVDRIVSYRWIPVQGVRTLIELGRRAGREDVLTDIRCPVLMLYSPIDDAASPDAMLEAFGRIPSNEKRKVRLDRSNHVLFWDYDRGEAYDEVLRFLGGL